MKISVLPSVNVIYLRIHKLIPIFYRTRRERVYWEESGKISKFKKQLTVHRQCPGDSDQSFTTFFILVTNQFDAQVG